VFRAAVLADGDSIGLVEFPQITAQLSVAAATPRESAASHTLALPVSDQPVAAAALFADQTPVAPVSQSLPAPMGADALPLLDREGEVRPLDQLEADLIRYAITHYRGQMSEVARRLRIGRSMLYRKLETLAFTPARAAQRRNSKPWPQSDSGGKLRELRRLSPPCQDKFPRLA
jgi:DNA-binding NtrC family response regulator